MRIRRGVKQLFFDMTKRERKEYLEITEQAVKIWLEKVMDILNRGVLEEIQMGHSVESKPVQNGLIGFKKALEFYSANCQNLVEWREIMKQENERGKIRTQKVT